MHLHKNPKSNGTNVSRNMQMTFDEAKHKIFLTVSHHFPSYLATYNIPHHTYVLFTNVQQCLCPIVNTVLTSVTLQCARIWLRTHGATIKRKKYFRSGSTMIITCFDDVRHCRVDQ